LKLNFDNLASELLKFDDKFRFRAALNVIKEYKLNQYSETLANLINNETINQEQMADIAYILKKLGTINLIDTNKIKEIKNENIKSLIESYL
ncbi:hypothetical protein IJ425_05520, partial [bacterium]|nr:hypothetical protein [bacterium]